MTFVDLAELEAPRTRSRVDMPFAPHLQCLSPDDRRLFVADAFGGELAVVDTDRCELVAARTVRASNIRGMAIDRGGENLLLAHQIVHRDRTTTEEGVHWGGVLSNVVRTLPIRLLVPTDIHERATAAANSNDDQQSASPVDDLFYLGHPDRAAGDPSATIETREGRRIVLFTGVNEVGISDIGANYYTPLAVGRCPSSMVLSRDESRLYVAATFDDAIDVIDVPARRKIARIELGSVRSLTAAEQGEALFHDASLASDGWYSCHSCHTDGHSNGALNDNFGDESYGAPKRIPTLGGVAQTGPWAWSGGLATLEGQIRKSIEITMQGAPPSDSQVAALAAYLRSLPPAPSVSEARRDAALREARRPDASTGELAAASIGERLFRRIGCAECHAPPHYTTPETYDVGFEDELGNRRFNPPSLLGVSQRRRLLHDGRAASVRDLLERLRHEIGDGDATPDELNELIRFVEGL